MYTILPNANPDAEAEARAAAEQAGIVAVVVMRPVRIDKELSQSPATYSGPVYDGFWGGYFGYGLDSPYGPGSLSGGEVRTDTIVTVESLVYSLRQNKLLWRGQSKTANPRDVDRLIEDTAKQVANELVRLGLMSAS